MGRDQEYAIHLREADGDQPIHTTELDYYDSGVWVHVEDGRDFYPYERIAVIREREVDADKTASTPSASTEDADGEYVDLERTIEGAESDTPEEAHPEDSAAVTDNGPTGSSFDPDED